LEENWIFNEKFEICPLGIDWIMKSGVEKQNGGNWLKKSAW